MSKENEPQIGKLFVWTGSRDSPLKERIFKHFLSEKSSQIFIIDRHNTIQKALRRIN